MTLRPQRTLQAWLALVAVLALGLAACAGTPNPTILPGQTEDIPVASDQTGEETENTEPEPTDAAEPTTSDGNGGENDLGNGRPSTVNLTIAGTTTNSDGSYSASGLTRICGNAQLNITGNTRGFNYAFPYENAGEIEDVTIDAEDLLAGTSTTSFYLNMNVVAKDGHSPPAVVIQPSDPDTGDTGTLQRTDANGTTTLTLNAVNSFGESATLTATCGPRPG